MITLPSICNKYFNQYVVNIHTKKIPLKVLLILVLFLWLTGFSFISLSPNTMFSSTYYWLKQFYSGVCHQNPDKCFAVNNISFLVCARCAGIYLGAFLASVPMLLIRKKIYASYKLIFASTGIIISDIILYSFGVYSYSKVVAFSTGIFSGSTAFIYILSVLENFLDELKQHESK